MEPMELFASVFDHSFRLLVGILADDGKDPQDRLQCLCKTGPDGDGLWFHALVLRRSLENRRIWIEGEFFSPGYGRGLRCFVDRHLSEDVHKATLIGRRR